MNEQKQRLAIALACGWKWYRWGKGGNLFLLTPDHDWSNGSMVPAKRAGDEEFRSDKWPDYLNSLDAMHEAEKTLNHEQRALYPGHLYEVFEANDSGIDVIDNASVAALVVSATAAQRAEAFLKAKGLWTE